MAINKTLHGAEPVLGSAPVITLVGGAGFLGKYIAQLLAREGYRIKIISRNPSAHSSVRTIGDLGQTALLHGDLCKPESVIRHIAGSHAVINLAGILFERGRQNFQNLHALGAEKLAQAAAQEGINQFIHISALGIDKASDSRYARTKLLGEKAVQNAFAQATVLRPGILFGPEDQFINRFAAMASILPVLPLFGGGNTRFQPAYVADVAHAVLACLKAPESTMGRTYELGGPQIYSFRQILELICSVLGRKPRFINIPFGLAGFNARFLGLLPSPPLTRDQVTLLKYDNIVSLDALTFKELGIAPEALEMVAPGYLSRFYKKPPLSLQTA